MIWDILTYAIGSFFWGLLIALACIGLFLFLVKGWYKDAYMKPVTFVIAIVLGLTLIYNCTILCRAIAMKSDLGPFESQTAETIKTSFSDYDTEVTKDNLNEIIRQVLKGNPIFYDVVKSGNYEGLKLSELPSEMTDTARSNLNSMILKHTLWSLAFFAIAFVLAVRTIGRSGMSRYRSRGARRELKRVNTSRRRAPVR